MVSRTPKQMMTRKSASDLKKGRPKRNISPKNLDDSVSGLSWREERELKKALYASLQESRRQSRDDEQGLSVSQSRTSLSSLADSKFLDESSCSVDSFPDTSKPGPSTSHHVSKKAKYHAQRKFAANSFLPIHSQSLDSCSQDLDTRFSSLGSQQKIHAQRKFAGSSSSLSTSYEVAVKPKVKVSPAKLFPVRPKTEDFLTYLCFRGTPFLPPHLDLMNIQNEEEYESANGKAGSEGGVANGRAGFTRDSSPASSSSMSHQNEDSMDVPEFPLKLQQTPNRKAARASASTPETARGFANLKRGRRKSGSKLSPASRKRLSDSYAGMSKAKSRTAVGKLHLTERLMLKRRAMATLTAKKSSTKKTDTRHTVKKLQRSKSDGELIKKRASSPSKSSTNGKKPLSSKNQTTMLRKRKSTGSLHDLHKSPTKKPKIRVSKRVKTLLKISAKSKSSRSCAGSSKSSTQYIDSLETHPNKRHSTNVSVASKVKRTFKPHRPMTRATSHLKTALKAAKYAANKKLKTVRKALPTSTKDSTEVSRAVKTERREVSASPEKKKKLSLESSSSKSSLSSESFGEVPIKTERFPESGDIPGVVQCPTYYPSDEQFRDPILYIQSIQSEAEQYGMCKIVPPCNWKMDSREMEDFRFTTHIQYVHKMFHKWSPITKELECIKKLYHSSGDGEFHVPQVGGVEIDLVKLYDMVQKYGGMKGTVGKEKKWMKIADAMMLPKQSDRVSKLYDAYCKYLLPYETLSDEETDKLADGVQTDRQKQEKDRDIESPACYRCVYKGKSQLLSAYNRAARNTRGIHMKEGRTASGHIEADYWKIVNQSDDHISAQGASLDTSIYGSMFPVRRDNPYARHGWNLHNFVESKGSILHHLGLIAGVTVPTLHVGMQYSCKCFSCNEHNLPTVQYLHQGDGLVWYTVPSHEQDQLRSALKKLIPLQVRDQGFCVHQNTLMIPPEKLVEHGVSLSRCVQSPREFVVVFPCVHYSNISLGYNLSESVHYGTQDWIPEGFKAAQSLSVNHDAEMFSMDAMLVFLARDQSTPDTTLALLMPYLEKVVDYCTAKEVTAARSLSLDMFSIDAMLVFLARDQSTPDTTLALLMPYLEKVVEREVNERRALSEAGLKESERLVDRVAKPSQKSDNLEEIIICDVSNKICYLSMVLNSHENSAFSLEQGLIHVQKKKNLKHCKLMFRYSEDELKSLLRDVKSRLRGSNSSSPASASPKRKTRKSLNDSKSSPASSTSSKQ